MKNKTITYLNKDFSQFRENLVQFIQTYYQDQVKDFTPNDPAMMFLEMSAYVGDVLSFYIDQRLQECFLPYAKDRKNVFALAQTLGYKPIPKTPSIVSIDVYQLIPSIGKGASTTPDWNYALRIKEGMQVNSIDNPGIIFRTTEELDFSINTKKSPTEISIYQIDGTGVPVYYLLKKTVTAQSLVLKEVSISVGNPQRFNKFVIQDSDVIQIIEVKDSDDNIWYEVPFLAHSTILKSNRNEYSVNPDHQDSPFVLTWVETPRRFVTRYRSDYSLELQFGGGMDSNSEPTEIVPNPSNIGLTSPFGRSHINDYFDQTVFLSNDSYGEVPANTILTIKYLKGGGIISNVGSNQLKNINLIEYDINEYGLDTVVLNSIKNSVSVNNSEPARGGRDEMTIEEIRENAISSFVSQYRAVTREDYTVRALSLPAKFGSISKVYVLRADENKKITNDITEVIQNINTESYQGLIYDIKNSKKSKEQIVAAVESLMQSYVNSQKTSQSGYADLRKQTNELVTQLTKNAFNTIDMYVLSYDNNGKLTETNMTVKNNLKKYFEMFKMLTDNINIINAFVVNVKVNFTITVLSEYNSNEIILQCISKLKDFFSIDKWSINQPIIKSDIIRILANIIGVQSVIDVEVKENNIINDNIHGVYNLNDAYDKDRQIWFPSLDPMIFEVYNPEQDIQGKVISY